MPGSDHETTLARQWELLRNHLPARPPGRTARELQERLAAAGHGVTKRTIERDLAELSRLFPILRNEVSIPYGWHWKTGAAFEVPGIDLAEAVSLGLMEDVLRQIMPPAFLSALEGRFTAAREKLAALPRLPHARWADLVRYVPPGLPFIPPAVVPQVLSAILEALLEGKQVKVRYLAVEAAAARWLTLHPLSLVQNGARPYLVATAFDYGEPFLYAIHRIADAMLIAEPATRPENYSLGTYVEEGGIQFGNDGPIILRARVSASLARLLEETPLSTDQRITETAGTHHLCATVHATWQLHFWILSQGAAITILEPASLRTQIIDALKAGLKSYGDG